MLSLSKDQKKALKDLTSWFNKPIRKSHITLGGYAGTGKTTLISIFRKDIHKKNKNLKVAFVCYTGKASRVLKNKLEEAKSIYPKDYIGTIHSLIYTPVENDDGEIIGWERKEDVDSDLIIIDEASMLNETIWKDLRSYHVPIIAVGDHGQLPPIHGDFNLMMDTDLKLEEIHRQARDNPIIKLSILAREVGSIPHGNFGHNVKKLRRGTESTQNEINELIKRYNDNTLILCGYNHTRIRMNTIIREQLGLNDPEPVKGDRVICLRNNHVEKIYNGMLGTIKKISPSEEADQWYKTQIKMDDEEKSYRGQILAKQFNNNPLNFSKKRSITLMGDLFDFGYALTVHKAQGSQAGRVILIEERFSQMDDKMWRRWLYTAVTRAERELIIVG